MSSNRREFIKSSCSFCASILGIGMILPALESCAPIAIIKTNQETGSFELSKSNFSAENKVVMIRKMNSEFDIAVVQLDENQYKAFVMQCTHQSNPLILTKSGFFCNAHGSSFDLNGRVQREPALNNLEPLPIQINKDSLFITL